MISKRALDRLVFIIANSLAAIEDGRTRHLTAEAVAQSIIHNFEIKRKPKEKKKKLMVLL